MELQVYEDAKGEWRWRAIAENGEIVADSAEGYVSKNNAERARDNFVAEIRKEVSGG